MSRILWAAFSFALGAVLTAVLVGFPKSPVIILPANPEDVDKLPTGIKRRVLIIGGGVAGLSAALELAERSYDVTIRESDSVLGGRIKTITVAKLGRTFQIDTGHLCVFHNYHQFHDIQQRLGVKKYYQPENVNHLQFRDYEKEQLYTWEPWPFNIIGMIMRSPNLSILQSFRWIHAGFDFVNFDYSEVYTKFGDMNFDDYDKARNLHPPFAAVILRPALTMTFNDPEQFSAAEFLLYSHLFSISNPEANRKDVATHNSNVALLGPWMNKLQSLGVRIELNSPAKGLVFDLHSNRVVAESSSTNDVYDHVILATDLIGAQHILDATLGSIPTDTALYNIVKSLIDNATSKLSIAPPYKLLWVWFDKQLSDSAPVVLQTPEFPPLTSILQLHLLQEEFMLWGNITGGSVLLFDLYAWQSGEVADDKLWEFISPVVKEIYPEIFEREFKVLDFYVHTGTSHPAFLKGMEQHRPNATLPSELGIPNLSFAGDWLHTAYPSVFMERAISTGREAANHAMLLDNVRQVPLTSTNPRGPGYM